MHHCCIASCRASASIASLALWGVSSTLPSRQAAAKLSGSAAGTDFEVPHLAVQVVWVLAGLHEAVENSLDLVGRDPQRGLADTNRPDLAALDLVVNGALVQPEMIGEVFDLPVLTFKGLDLHNCFRILTRACPPLSSAILWVNGKLRENQNVVLTGR